MGLDMHLEANFYIGEPDSWHAETRPTFTITPSPKGPPAWKADINPDLIESVTEFVGYWRKANAIHKWFVENVQDGSDDCGRYNVDSNQLQHLQSTVKTVLEQGQVTNGRPETVQTFNPTTFQPELEEYTPRILKNPDIAKELLPPVSGFFFGSNDIDSHYIDDLESTVSIIDRALNAIERGGSIYYSSSW